MTATSYSGIFYASPVAIAVSDGMEGPLVEVNRAFVELTGWERDEALGRTLDDLGLWIVPEEREKVLRLLGQEGAVREVEATLGARPGEGREVLVSAERLELGEEVHLIHLFHDISERKRAGEELARLALYDSLTDLPNRSLFRDRLAHALERARRESRHVAVLFMDLNRFKVVNDTLGHGAGDEVLKDVARRFRSCFRDEDTFARLGGDEFGAVLEPLEGVEQAERVARRLGAVLEAPLEVQGTEIPLSVSIGIAMARSGKGRPEDLLRFADIAMYRAKGTRGVDYAVFDPARDKDATRRLHRENELRAALKRDEFILVYQPVVDLRTGAIAGCEALMRWEHPERGLLAPAKFMALAEEVGVSLAIGERVMERAFEDVNEWRDRFGIERLLLTMNLTSRQFRDPGFLDAVGETVRRTGVDPSGIQLEIAEGFLLRGGDGLRRLRDLGFKLAIDDFGTGYSSLRDLKTLDVDAIKVDGSFIQDIGARPKDLIVPTMVRFAHGLGYQVVAEWVETPAQHRFLRSIDCDFGQGYLYSTPLPAPLFSALIGAPDRRFRSPEPEAESDRAGLWH